MGYNTLYNAIQCLMWSLHLAMVSKRPADMTSKICGNAAASLQVSHKIKKKRKEREKKILQTLKIYDALTRKCKYINYYE